MRVNARKVIAAVAAGKALKTSSSCWTDGIHVYSYATCIAARVEGGAFILNRERYSVTTTIYQNALAVVLSAPVGSHYYVEGFNGIAAEVDCVNRGAPAYRLAEVASMFGDGSRAFGLAEARR